MNAPALTPVKRMTLNAINTILAHCRDSEHVSKMRVFGSVARGADRPGDLDLVVELTHLSCNDFFKTGAWADFDFLLKFGYHKTFNLVGHFDPFIRLSDALLCRNDTSTDWAQAKNARALLKNIDKEGVPVLEVALLTVEP